MSVNHTNSVHQAISPELQSESDAINRDFSLQEYDERQAWNLYMLRVSGGAELLQILGAGKFAKALEDVKNLGRIVSLHDLVCAAEPEVAKRKLIYDQMLQGVKNDRRYQKNPSTGSIERGGNMPMAIEASVAKMRRMEIGTGLPLVSGVVERLKRTFVMQAPDENSREYLNFLSLERVTPQQLEQEFAAAGNDLYAWHAAKEQEFQSRRIQLEQRARTCVRNAELEMQNRIDAIRAKYRPEIAAMDADAQRFVIPPISKAGQAASATFTHLRDEFDKRIDAEIEAETKPLEELIDVMLIHAGQPTRYFKSKK